MGSPGDCDAAFRARSRLRYAPSFPKLRPARWQSVCSHAQVFGKTASTGQQIPNKKAPETGRLLDVPLLRQILAKQLALRELERFARLGAAVLLAFDHAGVAREEAALFQNVAQIRLE